MARKRQLLLAALALLAVLCSCGLPGDGSAQRVEDDAVPYRLLESGSSSPVVPDDGSVSDRAPVLVWLVDEERLVARPTSENCLRAAESVLERLLDELTAGPSEEVRAEGLSTAIPPESGMSLAGISDGTAEIVIDTGSAISPERLPGAVGQIVLTATSVAGVRSVVLVSDGEPVQLPLPGGALSAEPVTAADYASLLSDRIEDPSALGCPRS